MKRLALLGVVPAFLLLAACQQPTQPASQDTKVGASAVAEEITVDDAAAKPAFTTEGDWTVGAGGRDFKESVHWAVGNPEKATAKATWTPTITVAGTYEVFEYHGNNPSNDHASNQAFTITSADGSKTVEVNLTENIAKWNSLGKFKFAAGTSGTISTSNKANGNVLADAIKLVPAK
jgi:hypothetical protein